MRGLKGLDLKKPKLPRDDILRQIQLDFDSSVRNLTQIHEGEDSQALEFISKGANYIIRVNQFEYGFLKDKFCFDNFASEQIRIPTVLKIGPIKDLFYCISEKAGGAPMEDAKESEIIKALPAIEKVQRAIWSTATSILSGYGEFDSSGHSELKSWQEDLLTLVDENLYEWPKLISERIIDERFFLSLRDTYRRLVDKMPNERCLVHGDFGLNNILINDDQVSAVIDWDSARLGDPLFDIAGYYFWADSLKNMELARNYYEDRSSEWKDYRKRILCYQLRAALIQMYVDAIRGELQAVKRITSKVNSLIN